MPRSQGPLLLSLNFTSAKATAITGLSSRRRKSIGIQEDANDWVLVVPVEAHLILAWARMKAYRPIVGVAAGFVRPERRRLLLAEGLDIGKAIVSGGFLICQEGLKLFEPGESALVFAAKETSVGLAQSKTLTLLIEGGCGPLLTLRTDIRHF